MTSSFRYIALEGPEGGGKSLQSQRLKAYMESKALPVQHLQEPGGTPVGQEIRKLLVEGEVSSLNVGEEAVLFNAQRILLMHQKLRPALQTGHVLTDRTAYSTLVYQGLARGNAGVPVEVLKYIVNMVVGDTWPHLTIVLDVPAEIGLARKGKMENLKETRFESMGLEFHQRVRQGYLQLAEENPAGMVVIDAMQPEEKVFQAILENLRDKLSLAL